MRFATTAQLQVFERPNVDRNELWYTKRDYARMKLAIRRDVLAIRNSNDAVVGDDIDASNESEESVCLMGIEHLLTPACMNEVRACRARCIQAVLTASKARGCWLGQNCIRLDRSDKEGQNESEEAWSASSRIHLKALALVDIPHQCSCAIQSNKIN